MRQINLKEEKLPISLVDWINLYNLCGNRINFGLEFLSAATDGSIEIPNSELYQLPPDVKGRNLDETIEFAVFSSSLGEDIDVVKNRMQHRIARTKRLWRRGIKPWAIKAIDELREVENPDFSLDILKPIACNIY